MAGVFNVASLKDCHALAFVQSSTYHIDTRKHTYIKLYGHLPTLVSSAHSDAHAGCVWVGAYGAGLWEYELTAQTTRKVVVPHFP